MDKGSYPYPVHKHFTPDWVALLTGAVIFAAGVALGFVLG